MAALLLFLVFGSLPAALGVISAVSPASMSAANQTAGFSLSYAGAVVGDVVLCVNSEASTGAAVGQLAAMATTAPSTGTWLPLYRASTGNSLSVAVQYVVVTATNAGTFGWSVGKKLAATASRMSCQCIAISGSNRGLLVGSPAVGVNTGNYSLSPGSVVKSVVLFAHCAS
jgi:hypothetical protein